MSQMTKPLCLGLLLLGCSGGTHQQPRNGDAALGVDAAAEVPLVLAPEIVDATTPGVETDIVIDPSGAPHVLYFAPTGTTRSCTVFGSTSPYNLNALYHSTRPSAQSGAWTKHTVEVGAEPNGSGLVIDPSTQLPVVAYQGGQAADASKSPPGNYCGGSDARIGRYTGSTWQLSTVATHSELAGIPGDLGLTDVDTSGNVVGVWSALQIDSGGMWYLAYQDPHFNIANSDFNGADLEFARGQDGAGWQFEYINRYGSGNFTTMALDALQRPVVAYGGYVYGGVSVSQRMAVDQWPLIDCTAGQPSGGECPMAGQVRSSIAVAPMSKRLGVAYYDAVYKLVRLTESSDNGMTWSSPVVVDDNGDCGYNLSLRYDQQDRAVIAYYDRGDYSQGGTPDPTTGGVRVARQSLSDPTIFTVSNVDTGGPLACGAYTSLAIGPTGKAAIAYQCGMQGATPNTYINVVKYAYQQN